MTSEAAIRFAPLTTTERLNDAKRQGRTLYDVGALTLMPGKTVPLRVGHSHEIGSVRNLMRFDDIDGPWLCAIATLTELPDWLKRGTRASFEYQPLARSSFGDDTIRRGLITEVSVLSPGVDPAEPLAQVLYVKPESSPSEIIRTPRVLVRRTYRTTITIR